MKIEMIARIQAKMKKIGAVADSRVERSTKVPMNDAQKAILTARYLRLATSFTSIPLNLFQR